MVEILLIANRKKEAEKEVEILYYVTGNVRYWFLEWSLKYFENIPTKYYIYLLSPRKFFKGNPRHLQ